MTAQGTGVVIAGAGIVGLAAGYFLRRAGIACTVLERDSVGSHASGFAYGNLSPLGGRGIPGPLHPLAQAGMSLHRWLAATLKDETGIDVRFGDKAALDVVFDEQEAAFERGRLGWRQQQPGYRVSWLEPGEVLALEPRVAPDLIGGVHMEGLAEVDPYRLVLALAQAFEARGGVLRHGRVTGLKRRAGKVEGVLLENGELPCDRAVLAMGPWSAEAGAWLGVQVPVRPLKGQILRLRASGAPVECSVGWGSCYATTKPDGLLWVGTTEEEAGFDDRPTGEGRDSIMGALLKVMPAFADARLEQQTACLRPLSQDWLPILGPVPGWDGLYLATGAGRKGILVGPAMGQIAADLVAGGSTEIPIDALGVDRFHDEE